MDEIRVIFLDLPPRVHGFVTRKMDNNGMPFYIIVLNSRLSAEMQLKTYWHEVSHIENNDFESMLPVDQLEVLRHAI